MLLSRRRQRKKRKRTTRRKKIRRRKIRKQRAVKKRNRFILKEKTMTKFVYIFVKSPNSTSTFLVNQKGLGIFSTIKCDYDFKNQKKICVQCFGLSKLRSATPAARPRHDQSPY